MRRSAFAALLLTALLGAGCGADDEESQAPSATGPAAALGCDQGEARLLLDPERVQPGGRIDVRVENLTEDRVLTYGLASSVERAAGEDWLPVELPSRAIIEIALVVRPGESSRAGGAGASRDYVQLPPDLEPGTYRVVKEVTSSRGIGGAEADALRVCAPFEVAS